MIQPMVSCICPTFARAYLLEEAIESFLRQDYTGEKELVIYNDFHEQEFIMDHPEIKVVNSKERERSLGVKRDKAYRMASGELLLTWGDDDIHLPHRITRMVDFIGGGNVAKEGWHYCIHNTGIVLNRFPTCGAHIIRKDFYESTNGIPELDVGEDVAFNSRVESLIGGQIPFAESSPAFVYRWHGTERKHISGTGSSSPYLAILESATRLVNDGKEPKGKYHLKPKWKCDYVALVSNET